MKALHQIISDIISNQHDNSTKFSEFHRIVRLNYNLLSCAEYIKLGEYAYKNSGSNIELRNITLTCLMLAYIKIIDENTDITIQDKYSNDIFNFLFNVCGEMIKANQFHTQELADVELQIALDSFYSGDEKYLIEIGNFYSHFAYNTGSSFYLKRAINFYNIAINTTDNNDKQEHFHLAKFEFITNYLSKNHDPSFLPLNQTARAHLFNPNLDWKEKRSLTVQLYQAERMCAMHQNEFERKIIDFNAQSETYHILSIMWLNTLKEIELKDFVLKDDDNYKIVHEQLLLHNKLKSGLLDLLDNNCINITSAIPMSIAAKHGEKINVIANSIASSQFYLTFQSIIHIITLTNITLANNQLTVNPDSFFRHAEFIDNNFLRSAIVKFCSSPRIDEKCLRNLKEILFLAAIELAFVYKNSMMSAKDISKYLPGEQSTPNAISLASFAAAIVLNLLSTKNILDFSPEYLATEIVNAVMNPYLQNNQDQLANLHANFFAANKLSYNKNFYNPTQVVSNQQLMLRPQQMQQRQTSSTAMLMNHTSQSSNNGGFQFTLPSLSSTKLVAPSSSSSVNYQNGVGQQNITLFGAVPVQPPAPPLETKELPNQIHNRV